MTQELIPVFGMLTGGRKSVDGCCRVLVFVEVLEGLYSLWNVDGLPEAQVELCFAEA